jgi:hypothetical protein
MKPPVIPFLLALFFSSSLPGQEKTPSTQESGQAALLNLRRVYVAELAGGSGAEPLRQLLISSLDSLKLFVLTDNPDRADAVLRGAADDQAFTDTFDSSESVSGRDGGGKYGSGSGSRSHTSGGYIGLSAAGAEAHHIKERKHEAFASVRLCTKDGDVLWSTTQESSGAKFRSASADVAAKVAHQLGTDINKARQTGTGDPAASAPTPVKP